KSLGSQGRGQGGPGVAYRRRIRHKLILGLGLVVGIISLLLAGTTKGVLDYSMAMKCIESKMAELGKLLEFQNDVKGLEVDNKSDFGDELGRLSKRLQSASKS